MSLAGLSSQVYCLRVWPEPTGVQHLTIAPLLGRLLTAGKRSSLLCPFVKYDLKKFLNFGPAVDVIKLFMAVGYEFS